MTEPVKPLNPSFSSGPTAKFKGWSLSELNNSLIGRSHRSSDGKLKLKKCIEETKQLLKLPDDFLAENEIYRSKTPVCLKIIDPWFC